MIFANTHNFHEALRAASALSVVWDEAVWGEAAGEDDSSSVMQKNFVKGGRNLVSLPKLVCHLAASYKCLPLNRPAVCGGR